MLRVGLTGGAGSGKSAVAAVWAAEGVPILEADALGRALMQPGEAVFSAIVRAFGSQILRPDGELDRAALAGLAFAGGRLAELNALVHPAVIAKQEAELQALEAAGAPLAVVESALIFEASEGHGGAAGTVPGWRQRFAKLVLVTAPVSVRIERYILRVGGAAAGPAEQERLRADATRRIEAQLPDDWKRSRCDYVIPNNRTLVLLRREALAVLQALRRDAETVR